MQVNMDMDHQLQKEELFIGLFIMQDCLLYVFLYFPVESSIQFCPVCTLCDGGTSY